MKIYDKRKKKTVFNTSIGDTFFYRYKYLLIIVKDHNVNNIVRGTKCLIRGRYTLYKSNEVFVKILIICKLITKDSMKS